MQIRGRKPCEAIAYGVGHGCAIRLAANREPLLERPETFDRPDKAVQRALAGFPITIAGDDIIKELQVVARDPPLRFGVADVGVGVVDQIDGPRTGQPDVLCG